MIYVFGKDRAIIKLERKVFLDQSHLDCTCLGVPHRVGPSKSDLKTNREKRLTTVSPKGKVI